MDDNLITIIKFAEPALAMSRTKMSKGNETNDIYGIQLKEMINS
jgi:hypothetical protein